MSRRSLRTTRRSSRAALVEALETRILLYDYVFNGTNAAESIFAQVQGGNLVVGIDGGSGIVIPSPVGKTVLISALGGNDQVHLVSNGGAIITVDAGAGDDIIQLGGGGTAQNLSNLPGVSTLIGGSGNDSLLVQDGNNPVASTYTITDARFDRPGWGGFFYEADIESLTLYPTQLNDTVNVRSTWPNQQVRISNRGGDDTINIGNASQGVQQIRANVYTQGAGTNSLYISDVGNRSNLSANFDWDGSSAWGALNSFAPARIIWQAANTARVHVTAGGGVNSFVVYGNNSYLIINKGDSNIVGADTVQIGSPLVGGLVSILAPVQVENDLQLTNLVITNQGDPANRTWTIDSANGYGSLVGIAPAAIYWDNLDISTISLRCGGGSDTGLIKRLSETLSINNSSPSANLDTIQIGHSDVGAQQITGGGITIDNDGWYTDLTIDNRGDGIARTATLDFVNGYNVLTGLAPATIRYDGADTKNVAIHTGSGLNAFNLLRTTTSGGRTFIGFDNLRSSVHVGNATTGLQSIQATLQIDAVLNLTLDNRADSVARNIIQTIPEPTIPWGQITGLAPAPIHYHCAVSFAGGLLASLQLLGGNGGNTYTIGGTSDTGAFRKIWRLDTGPGDVVTVDGANIPSWAESRVELIDPVASLASLTIQNNASVELAGPANQVLVTGSINVTGTAALDVRDKAVIVTYSGASPIDAIGASIASGYNAGAWNGPGIGSSVAATTPGRAVGFAEATDLFSAFPATFAGQSIDNTSVLLRYTINGDADLNQTTDLADFNRLAANFGQSLRRWSMGDFNFDTIANLNDFNVIAGQFGQVFGPDAVSLERAFCQIPILPSVTMPDRELAALLAEFV